MAQISGGGIVMTTSETSPYAGNIASLTWNGKEFIQQADTGFMTSIALVAGEGHVGTQSYMGSLVSLAANGNYLENRIRMRYKDGSGLSNDYCTGNITIGWAPLGLDRVVEWTITHEVTDDHSVAGGVFEELEAGMPTEFHHFYTIDPVTHELLEVGESGAGYVKPLIITTDDQQHAIGFYSPDKYPSADQYPFTYVCLLYSEFTRFSPTHWRDEAHGYSQPRVPVGTYTFHNFVIIGSLNTVKQNIWELHNWYYPPVYPPLDPTHFLVNTNDLSNILRGRLNAAIANTGYKVGGVDLAQLCEGLASGSAPAVTGFKVGGADLNTLFSKVA